VEVQSTNLDHSIDAYLYLHGSEGHVNDQMYELFALPEVDTGEAVEKPQVSEEAPIKEPQPNEKPTADVAVNQEVLKITSPEISVGVNENVTCFVVESATILKCQLSKYQDKLGELMNQIAECAESLPKIINPTRGNACIAKYSVDEGWYRGRVVETGEEYSVEFVDFGNTEKVTASDVKQISAELTNLPQCCITVSLHDVHLKDIDVAATKLWMDEKLEHTLRLEIIMMLNETSVSANVYDEGREDHINDQVYELFALEEVVGAYQ